jgi:hypothetical protein
MTTVDVGVPRRSRWLVAGLLLSCALGTAAEPAQPRPVTLAILPFAADTGLNEATAANLTDLLTVALAQDGTFALLERDQWQAIMAEQQLRDSGLSQTQRLVQAGQLLGAQLLVTGRVFNLGRRRTVIAQCISCETQQTVGAALRTEAEAPLLPTVEQLAAALLMQVQTHRAGLLPSTVTLAESVAQLRLPMPPTGSSSFAIRWQGEVAVDVQATMEQVVREGFAAAGFVAAAADGDRYVTIACEVVPLAKVRGRSCHQLRVTLQVAAHGSVPAATVTGQRVFMDDAPGGTERVIRELTSYLVVQLLPRLLPAEDN